MDKENPAKGSELRKLENIGSNHNVFVVTKLEDGNFQIDIIKKSDSKYKSGIYSVKGTWEDK